MKINQIDFEQVIPEYLRNSRIIYVVATDLKGYYTYVNEAFRVRYSFLNIDFVGSHSFVAIHLDDHAKCEQTVKQCFSDMQHAVQVDLRKPDSSIEDSALSSWEFSMILNEDGNPLGVLCIGYDITKEELASRQALMFASKVERIIEEIPDGFIQLDVDNNIVNINSVAAAMLRVKRDEAINSPISEVIPKSVDFNGFKKLDSLISGNNSITFEEYYAPKQTWLRITVYSSTEGRTVLVRNITKEHESRMNLENSEIKLRAILDSTKDANILISMDYSILNFNKSAQEEFKSYYSQELAIGKDVRTCMPEECVGLFKLYRPSVMDGERRTVDVKRKINNRTYWYEITFSPVYYNGRILGIAKNIRDITEKKDSDLRISNNEYFLKAIYHSTTESCTFIDPDFVIRYCNIVAERITKELFGKEAQPGESALDYVLPQFRAEFQRYYQKALGGEEISFEKSDGKRWWRFVVYPVYDEKNKVIGIAHNVQEVTERMQRELVIQEQNVALKNIAWQQSHELRRPLANVISLSHIVLKDDSPPKEDGFKKIELLKLSVEELDRVIHRIVYLASHKANSQDIS